MDKWMAGQKHRWFLIAIVLALLVGACVPDTPEPTPRPTQEELTPTDRAPTATPTTGPPTATPLPTMTPLPLPPPRLLSHSPALGEEQALEAPIVLIFDQPMDQDSVEAAVDISPPVAGDFSWADNRTLSFQPAKGELDRGESYLVALDDGAKNIEGKSMAEPAAFELSTVGYLAVSEVMPLPDSDELDPNTIVTVVFDRPVVPLTAINRQSELPQPLTFVPPVRGEGEWLNTSIYQFRPDKGFLPATKYKARVAAGLTDLSGGILEKDYAWTFTTIRPAVLMVQPQNNFLYVGPTDTISVTFNQQMDHTSVIEHFSLEADGQSVTGSFRWRGGDEPTEAETMVFEPDDPLPRNTAYEARVEAGALAQSGNLGKEKDKAWEFSTVANPSLYALSPENGSLEVEPGTSMAITFASPMQREGFLDHLSISPQVTDVYTYWSEFDTKVRVRFKQEPDTQYAFSLDADTPDKYGATLGRSPRWRFTTGDLRPYATLNTGGRLGTFSAYTETVVYATHRNVSRLDLSLYRLSPEDFIDLNNEWDAWHKFEPDKADLVRNWARRVNVPRNETHLARINLVDAVDRPLSAGLYFLQLSAPEVRASREDYRPSRYMFVKSRLNLALKQSRDEVLVWATDLSSGQPVANLEVSLHDDRKKLPQTGATDTDGLFQAGGMDVDSLWDTFMAIAGEPGDDDFGLAYNQWNDGINTWDFELPSEYYSSDFEGYVYTDRPIYRPGQTVYFKGIARADDDARYSLPTDPTLGDDGMLETLQVRIEDPRGKELYQEELPLSDMGTLFDELVLDEEAPLGNYFIELQQTGRDFYASTSFRVAEYKKPEFQVSVVTDRDAYLGGEDIAMVAEGTYYFGGAVADAGVHWSVLTSDYSFQFECPQGQSCPWYSWSDYSWDSYAEDEYYGDYGRLIAEGDAQTDAQGRVTFDVPADLTGRTQSQIFTIEASLTDLNGQQVSNRTATIVHQGEFYTGVAPQGYLAEVGEEKEVDLLTVDWDGEPVDGVDLTVTFMEHRWYSVKEQEDDGQYYWTWIAEDIPVLTTTVTTGDDGRAASAFTPEKAGTYRVRAVGQDSQANQVRSSAYFWVWGGSEYVNWRRESNNRIELIADKEEYQVGDVAEILVPSPYSDTVQALITVERGHILETEVRELEGNSEVLRVPITEDHVPNAYASVILVQGSEQAPDGLATFKMGLVKLPISVATKELDIKLTPDKDIAAEEHYGPRQTATYDVLVSDHEGQPVEAELSLRLADLAVLALADERGPTLLEKFWRDRGLGVRTSMPLAVSMEAFNREISARAKGGGGGEDDGRLRSRFADTAFWDPVVRTDEDGKAQVTVQLPDNLTTWRMQARGITADTRVGRAEVDVLSTLDLLVRPVLPRFFVVGDEAQIATVVHNNTAEALEVRANISAEGLALEGAASRIVQVPAGDKVKVTWPVKALDGEKASVRMWASSGDLYDGREDLLPIYRYSTPEVVATAGHLSEAGVRQEIVQLPRTFDPTQGELEVQVDGSLTAATQDAVDYLEHYPYECVEQTVSRFLPNVVTWRAMDEMGLERPELRKRLAQMVGTALQRLYNQQHYDGGWGWWVTDDSNPYLTAYVLQGMLEAQRAGFVVDEEAMLKGMDYLRDALPSVSKVDSHWEANRMAYQLYVMADYLDTFDLDHKGELGTAVRLFEKRHLLSRYGQATLAMALSLLDPEDPQRAETLLGDLAGDAVFSATGTHWEEDKPDYWNMNTDIRTTAIVIWALSRLEPDSELLPNAVRWLMAVRQQGYWESTQTTSWALLGLVEYMRASGELQGDFSYSVYLNGQEWASGDVSPENIDESQKLQVEIAQLLADEANRLVIERHEPQADQSGKGELYYTAHLRYYLPAEQVQALDRGILVARQYSLVDAPREYVDAAQVGDVVKVKLTLIAPTDLHYVVVEDPLPAGFEGVDLSLKTTSVVGEKPELRNLSAEEEDYWYRWYGWGWWWFSHSEMRDEKVALFARYLPRGTYEYTYLIRAGVPGEFKVMPTTAYQMYFPEVFGRGDGGKFTVEPAN